MKKQYAPENMMIRDGVHYYVCHIPCELASIYSITKSGSVLRVKSVKNSYL